MNRFYVLTKHGGVAVIEAVSVDHSSPIEVRFVSAAGARCISRGELLWCAPVDPFPLHRYPAFPDDCGPSHPYPNQPGMPGASGNASQQPEFFERSDRVERFLVSAVRAAAPTNWKNFQLEMKVGREETGRRYNIAHRILNSDTGAEVMDFSDVLFALIDVYHRIDLEVGYNWIRSTLTVYRGEKGQGGKIEAKFEYSPAVQAAY